MPNLKEWTETQLKKGYSEQQIKDYLAKRGYSSQIVSEPDISKSSNISSRKINNPKNYQPIIIFILIVILILFSINIFISINQNQPGDSSGQSIQTLNGKLVKIMDQGFIIEKGGINYTIIPDKPLDEIKILKVIQSVDANIEDFKIGNQVTISGYIDNNQSTILKIEIIAEK